MQAAAVAAGTTQVLKQVMVEQAEAEAVVVIITLVQVVSD
jgi:hypothetical protein